MCVVFSHQNWYNTTDFILAFLFLKLNSNKCTCTDIKGSQEINNTYFDLLQSHFSVCLLALSLSFTKLFL